MNAALYANNLKMDKSNTKQAMSYGFRLWQDFFNDRQLLALGRLRMGYWLPVKRDVLTRTLFSGASLL